ncbi:hypothetical protein M422DRAFT_273385 [Sphaerobolus stellatus SS14]|uniref:cystathionine gamma-synthase n=1 Tax=Sphaerobolus stellatus (strain SS14) TaxID=990650 RepID=A0A0C9T968_SPHS4|nr:hypothetical protein M422DRAFT_273385 [Sphaerobolus stellatus SS14]
MSAAVTSYDKIVCPSLGDSIPSALPHAISVSLPTWKDNVGYEEGERRVIDAMCTGYPRFFVHKSIQKLSAICEAKFGLQNEQCMLFPKAYIANRCRDFMIARSIEPSTPLAVRLVQWIIHADETSSSIGHEIELHIVLFPSDAYPIAKQFWQHAGLGISSRMAVACLSVLEEQGEISRPKSPAMSTSPPRTCFPSRNRHYGSKATPSFGKVAATTQAQSVAQARDEDWNDQGSYLEERYGRNLPTSAAMLAKRTLRRRIAGVLAHEEDSSPNGGDELRPSTRGVEGVTEEDVYLFPTGMAAIWSAHQLCLASLPPAKSVCFGFTYTDTLKILQKWGPGCYFFGNGDEADVDALEALLSSSESPKILALLCEFPSNPLLRSANLGRLRNLADRYDFPLVIDETVGNFVNVEILPFADILVSSLSKVFSGETNVMGGSLILNPKGKHYPTLKAKFEETYEDSYWYEDAIYMERNSRNFVKRVWIINRNTEAVCDFLHSYSRLATPNPVIKNVYYPKWESRQNYDVCRLPLPEGEKGGNFGGLFSITFTSEEAAHAFFDTLPCAKGPSLGTNFTLACPYTILAHFTELDWAAEYGVEKSLVRVSVGLEDRECLLAWFGLALKAAEEAGKSKTASS